VPSLSNKYPPPTISPTYLPNPFHAINIITYWRLSIFIELGLLLSWRSIEDERSTTSYSVDLATRWITNVHHHTQLPAYILLFIYIFLLLLYLVYSSYSYVPQLSVISTHRLRVSTHIPILSIYLFTLLQLYLLIYNRFVLPDNTVISTHRLRLYLLIYNKYC